MEFSTLQTEMIRCIVWNVGNRRMRKALFMDARALSICLMLLSLVGPLAAGEVENVRVWAGPDKTRVVLDLDREVEYKVFALEGPDRLVVDIDRTSMTGVPELDPEVSGVVRKVRHGIREGEDLRVVLDLADATRVKSFLLAPTGRYGHRLVLDLFPKNATSAEERVRSVARSLPDD